MLNFGFKDSERPRPFCSDPRPRRGRHILAPRDPGDPATQADPANPGGAWRKEARAAGRMRWRTRQRRKCFRGAALPPAGMLGQGWECERIAQDRKMQREGLE